MGGPRDLCTLAKMAKNQRGSGDSRKNSGDEPQSWWSVFKLRDLLFEFCMAYWGASVKNACFYFSKNLVRSAF